MTGMPQNVTANQKAKATNKLLKENKNLQEYNKEFKKIIQEDIQAQKNDMKATDAKVGEDKLTKSEVKEWATTDTVIDKYKERYKEECKAKLNEVVAKMIEKL